jgi:hypothetical protein
LYGRDANIASVKNSFHVPETCKVSADDEDTTEDVLSNITVDSWALEGWFATSEHFPRASIVAGDCFYTDEQTMRYNEELVQRRVAESAFAEPWTGLSAQGIDFSMASTLSQTVLAAQPDFAGVPVDATDSGYSSHISKPLSCLVCGKQFKNKAEEKYETSSIAMERS